MFLWSPEPLLTHKTLTFKICSLKYTDLIRYILEVFVQNNLVISIINYSTLFFTTSNYWSVRKWEDAAMLAFWLALLYVTLEGPHQVRLYRLK